MNATTTKPLLSETLLGKISLPPSPKRQSRDDLSIVDPVELAIYHHADDLFTASFDKISRGDFERPVSKAAYRRRVYKDCLDLEFEGRSLLRSAFRQNLDLLLDIYTEWFDKLDEEAWGGEEDGWSPKTRGHKYKTVFSVWMGKENPIIRVGDIPCSKEILQIHDMPPTPADLLLLFTDFCIKEPVWVLMKTKVHLKTGNVLDFVRASLPVGNRVFHGYGVGSSIPEAEAIARRDFFGRLLFSLRFTNASPDYFLWLLNQLPMSKAIIRAQKYDVLNTSIPTWLEVLGFYDMYSDMLIHADDHMMFTSEWKDVMNQWDILSGIWAVLPDDLSIYLDDNLRVHSLITVTIQSGDDISYITDKDCIEKQEKCYHTFRLLRDQFLTGRSQE